MPSRKEIQWAQLRVGVLVLVAVGVLVGLIILMSGATGGLFSRKIVLRTYFKNADGLKDGAPVTLEGVTIGSVVHVRVIPRRNPTPVEVAMRVGEQFIGDLHTDSSVKIEQAGALGDSFIDITSVNATGPAPGNDAELKSMETSSIQEVLGSSQATMEQISGLIRKIDVLVDTLNSTRGSAGMFLNDRALYNKISSIAENLQSITGSISSGKGSLGKLLNDDTLYTHANDAVDKLDKITADLQDGKGTAGKLLKDETLYNNLNSAVKNTNEITAQINSGQGAAGKLLKDPVFARKLEDTVSNLDAILKGINDGKGTLGQLAQNRSVYDHADQMLDQTQQLVKAIREDPKKYFVIRLKMF